RHGLAVVELDALPDLERPHLRVVGCAPFLGDAWLHRAVGRELHHLLAPLATELVRHLALPGSGIEAVGGLTALHARLQDTSTDRFLRQYGARKQRAREGRAHAERGRTAEEVAAAQLACGDPAAQIVEFV